MISFEGFHCDILVETGFLIDDIWKITYGLASCHGIYPIITDAVYGKLNGNVRIFNRSVMK